MKTIPLSQGKVAFVDDDDYERVMQFKWSLRVSRGINYAGRNIQKNGTQKLVYLHRFIMNYDGELDHKNRNGLDNQKHNLRPATRSQNCANSRRKTPHHSSKFRGVYLHRPTAKTSPWKAQISVNGNRLNLGYYSTEEDAAVSYNHAALAYFGEFAVLNPI